MTDIKGERVGKTYRHLHMRISEIVSDILNRRASAFQPTLSFMNYPHLYIDTGQRSTPNVMQSVGPMPSALKLSYV